MESVNKILKKYEDAKVEVTMNDAGLSSLSKRYLIGDPLFANIGNSDKRDVNTSEGWGMLKYAFSEKVHDCFSEELCYLIAKALGVPCVYTRMVKADDSLCVFSKYEIDDSTALVSLESFLGNKVVDSASDIFNALPESMKQPYLIICAFDYLTRQVDRHTCNLSVYKDREEFYPLFDNGLSLFAHVDDTLLNLSPKFRMRYDYAKEVLGLIRIQSSKETKKFIRGWELDIGAYYTELSFIPEGISKHRLDHISAWLKTTLSVLKEVLR